MNNQDTILFYIHGWFTHFCIAKFLKEQKNCKSFAIVDFDEKAKPFFQNQNLINFEKLWFYKDSIKNNLSNPDLEYLSSFEKKYDINLWKIIYTDKTFYKFNNYYHFNNDEILSLIEQEAKFFEKILDDSKPDFYAAYLPQSHHERLLYEMCRAKKIPILMLSPARIAGRFMVTNDDSLQLDTMDNELKTSQNKTKTLEEIRSYMEKYDATSYISKMRKASFETNRIKRYKSILKFFFSFDSSNYDSRYSNYGRTKTKVFLNKIKLNIQRKRRQSFIDKNLIHEIDLEVPFVYFPLHYEPEYVLLSGAPYFDNQLAVITSIAKSLPVGYKLYVKEHPQQGTIGWKDINFYKSIMRLPNVYLLHPTISSNKLVQNSSLVCNIAGTTGLEAALYNKPTVLFSDQIYSKLPSVHRVKNLEELPQIIKTALQKQVNVSELSRLIEIIDKNSINFDLDGMGIDFAYRFGFKGPVMDAELPTDEVVSFIEDHKSDFQALADAHIKKINQYKESQSKQTVINDA